MKKAILISLVVVLLVVAAIIIYFFGNMQVPDDSSNNPPPPAEIKGIQVFSPKENEVVSSPLKISGVVNGDGWIGFEGQVGVVRLFDDKDKELGLAILTASGEWMQTKIDFETTLWFDYPGDGVGKLVFYNENPSGEAERNKTFTLPVKLSKSSSSKTTVKVYFSSGAIDSTCNMVIPFNRDVPKTSAVAMAALEELLKGPTKQEKNAAIFTSINPGVKIQSLKIENGMAIADFSEELNKDVSGSCRVIAILSQITETLKQFPTVKQVTISVNGESEEILQP